MPSMPLDPLTSYRQKQANTALLNVLSRSFGLGSMTLAGVRQALDDGADPNVRATTVDHGKGARPLHLAAKHGAARAVIELLVERGATVDATMPNGHTPLHVAARHGDVEALHALLDAGASITARTKNGLTPLGVALLVKPTRLEANGHGVLPTVDALMARGATLDGMSDGTLHPLHEAARQLNVGVLAFLLERGVSANTRDAQDQLPLGVLRGSAAFAPRWWTGDEMDRAAVEVVDRLVHAKAEVNVSVTAEAGETALSYLLQAEHVPQTVVQRLLEAGSSPQGTAKRAMGRLAARGDVETLTTLFRHGVSADQVDDQKESLLHHTVRSGTDEAQARLHAVQRLALDHGADPNVLDREGFSPLHRALLLPSTALTLAHARVLLENGADPNLTTLRNVSPLLIAGQPDMASDLRCFNPNKRGPLIDLLLAHGADPVQATFNSVPLPFAKLQSPLLRERVDAHFATNPPSPAALLDALQKAWIRETPERVSVMLDVWLRDTMAMGVEPQAILTTYQEQAGSVFGERQRGLETMVPILEARILKKASEQVADAVVANRPRARL